MNYRDFAYWLQGFYEVQPGWEPGKALENMPISAAQSKIIQEHLAMAFAHEKSVKPVDGFHDSPLGRYLREGRGSDLTLTC